MLLALARDYNVLHNAGIRAGQTVLYAHFHLIPKEGEHDGLRFAWETDLRIDQQELYQTLKQLLARSR